MDGQARKRQLDVESQYWELVLAGIGTVEACRAVWGSAQDRTPVAARPEPRLIVSQVVVLCTSNVPLSGYMDLQQVQLLVADEHIRSSNSVHDAKIVLQLCANLAA